MSHVIQFPNWSDTNQAAEVLWPSDRAPDSRARGRGYILTLCCVLRQDQFTSQKYPGSGGSVPT